jgi:diacylglycerol kinase (ATP)
LVSKNPQPQPSIAFRSVKMHNKPKFNLFTNVGYAMDGMIEVLRSENSFKMQLVVITLIGLTLPFVPMETLSKLILFISTLPILIAEAFNSAIERVVDLVTKEYHPLAKQAKDIGAFGVFLAFLLTVGIWTVIIYIELSSTVQHA